MKTEAHESEHDGTGEVGTAHVQAPAPNRRPRRQYEYATRVRIIERIVNLERDATRLDLRRPYYVDGIGWMVIVTRPDAVSFIDTETTVSPNALRQKARSFRELLRRDREACR